MQPHFWHCQQWSNKFCSIGPRWKEPRLTGPVPEDENYYQPIDTGFIKNLWVPDVYLWYLKSIEVLDFLIPFAGKLSSDKGKD